MAVRGSATRHVPGYPMAGVLRELNRQARTLQARARPPALPELVPVPAPEPEPDGEPAPPPPAAAVVVTAAGGRATWQFPRPYEAPPVVAALAAVVPVLGPLPVQVTTVMVEEVTTEGVTVRAWHLPSLAGGLLEAAAAGVQIHLTATPATLV